MFGLGRRKTSGEKPRFCAKSALAKPGFPGQSAAAANSAGLGERWRRKGCKGKDGRGQGGAGQRRPSRFRPWRPRTQPKLPPLAGVRLATVAAGIRYQQRTDVLLALLAPGTQVAGVFTTSKTASAPVLWCRDKLKGRATARVLVVNSGNANAFTGKAGMEGVREIADERRRHRPLPLRRSLHGLHRGDRRAAAHREDHRASWPTWWRRAPPATGAPPPTPS